MHQRHRLAVAAQKLTRVDVHQRKDLWIEVHLQRHREKILRVGQHDRDLKGAAYGLVHRTRNDGDVQRRCGRRGRWSGGVRPGLLLRLRLGCHLPNHRRGVICRRPSGRRKGSGVAASGGRSQGFVVVDQLDRLACSGVDGPGVLLGKNRLANNMGDEQENDLILLLHLVRAAEEVFQQRNLTQAGCSRN